MPFPNRIPAASRAGVPAPHSYLASAATGFALSETKSPATSETASTDPMSTIAAATQEAQMLYELTQDLGGSLSLQEALAFVGVRLKRLIPYE